ncbi:ATP-binding protein [Vibrio coralliirubri]|uniref:ATP-binding protein n=1 Tax=Vibrio coralliirubri TaxID=1516159 RepID=UPI0022832FC8|nr:ATP-binding protein [Vibrio coralliirubri]MCY9860932.1 ATP-binding protein [Vibrio coralliirubri]
MSEYNGNSMDTLQGLDPVRKRPGMYIGSTDGDGVRHCFVEIIDNAIDEAISGYCDTINVTFSKDGYISIQDNGRGIPVDINDKSGLSAAILVYTNLHSGGKFENKNYKYSGGLHGVGSSVVNALSTHLELTIKRDGKIHYIEFVNGGELTSHDYPKIIGECDINDTGTTVRYKLDATHFQGAITANDWEIKQEWLDVFLHERAAITNNLLINLDYKGNTTSHKANNGLADLLVIPEYSETATPIMREAIMFCEESEYKGQRQVWDSLNNRFKTDKNGKALKESYKETIELRFAFLAQDKLSPAIPRSFMNNIRTKNHGKHYDGFVNGYSEAVRDYAFNTLKINHKIINEDIMAGCQVAILAFAQDIEFKGQTKDQVTSSKVATVGSALTKEFFVRWLDTNPVAAKQIVDKSVRASKQREANAKAKEEEEKAETGSLGENLTGVLTTCRSNKLEETELFIVEGDSAGGTARGARDKNTQAILPLRGKILNTYKSDIHKTLKSKQIRILASAIGTGLGKDYDYKKLRYGKIIPLTDADVDGAHIQLLFVSFMYKYMPDLIKRGHLFIAETPLYKLEKKGANKQVKYIKNDAEFNSMYPDGIPAGWERNRFKGLGEMNPPQLRETAMNVDTRVLKQVQFDEEKSEEYCHVFDVLMGSDPEKRALYIKKYVNFHE